MKSETASSAPHYPLADLCVLADLPPRAVHYYVQIGLVDRPEGEKRAARYGAAHLEQLLLIKKWTAGGCRWIGFGSCCVASKPRFHLRLGRSGSSKFAAT